MDNMCEDNLTYGVSELAKRSNISVSLSGWPAAFAIMLIPCLKFLTANLCHID